MKTVMQWFKLPIKYKTNGDVGIEIEVEGENLPYCEAFWNNEEDGSLRGKESREYVLKKPLSLQGAREALNYLGAMYEANETKVDDSVRAGVHVHINVQQLNMVELYNFITLYLILEEPFVKFCGPTREGNLFCLRSIDAGFLLSQLQISAESKHFTNLVDDSLRYSSINVKALGTYGSLEFRAMRGTRDLDLIHKWAEVLLNLREVSKTYENPQKIIEEFSDGRAPGFLEKILGGNAHLFKFEKYEEAMYRGVRNAQDIAYCVGWSDYHEVAKKLIGNLEFPIDCEFPDEPLEDH